MERPRGPSPPEHAERSRRVRVQGSGRYYHGACVDSGHNGSPPIRFDLPVRRRVRSKPGKPGCTG